MLNQRLQALKTQTRSGFYRKFRTTSCDLEELWNSCSERSPCKLKLNLFLKVLSMETPVIMPEEHFQFTRTVGTRISWEGYGKFVANNLAPDYKLLLQEGIAGRLALVQKQLAMPNLTEEETEFLSTTETALLAVKSFAGKYAEAAEKKGKTYLANLLRKVPFSPADTLEEALQSIYFYHAMMRLSGSYHLGFGRADQYFLPFYRNDLKTGKETPESARELLTEFFLILNRDSDLYPGMQAGDNGQTMVLGGILPDASSGDNELTCLLMDLSADLAMIEPKINLRMTRHTSDDILRSAARLSGCGYGFPQYTNDEIVIPSLVKFGYPIESARNYSISACWTFLLENGRDIANLYAVNLALAADRAIRSGLRNGDDFSGILKRVPEEIRFIMDQIRIPEEITMEYLPDQLLSAIHPPALEQRKDINVSGGDHGHFGCHGCGSSTAADSLAAVKKFVFEEQRVRPEEFLQALEQNFEGFEELQAALKSDPDKVGCASESADQMLKFVFNSFADVLEAIGETHGGRIRPGTGSALEFVRMTQENGPQRLHATADGRSDLEFISSSLAPAPGVKANGILSVLSSFSKLDYIRVCNGGPITMELDPVYFKSEKAIDKMISFLRAFLNSGCQQLQLNTLDAETLKKAQINPENYRNLVVRVWGWSGYFVELDREYQDHIIQRQAFRG